MRPRILPKYYKHISLTVLLMRLALSASIYRSQRYDETRLKW
jgi:hypothetical protein